jgi:hypothetical protein
MQHHEMHLPHGGQLRNDRLRGCCGVTGLGVHPLKWFRTSVTKKVDSIRAYATGEILLTTTVLHVFDQLQISISNRGRMVLLESTEGFGRDPACDTRKSAFPVLHMTRLSTFCICVEELGKLLKSGVASGSITFLLPSCCGVHAPHTYSCFTAVIV